MCLLAVCQTECIREENFREAFRVNSDGFGFAFRNKDKLTYVKGFMDVNDAWKNYKEFTKEKIFPHVIHFRLGKPTLNVLTHPFEISEDSVLNLTNTIEGNVLFHNGVITGWRDRMYESFAFTGKIPEGPIIDTRVAAIWANKFGKRIFDFIDGKFVIFGPETLEMIGEFSTDRGVDYSNNSYKVIGKYYYSGTNYSYGYHSGYTKNPRTEFNSWEKDKIDEFII